MYSTNKKNYDEDIDLRQTWSVISRNRWVILGFSGVATLVAAWVVITMTPTYTASATVLIESQQANVVSIEEVYAMDTRTQQYYETQFKIMNSRPLVERVIAGLELGAYPEFDPDRLDQGGLQKWASWIPFELPKQSDRFRYNPLESIIEAYYENFTIEPIRDTQLVNLHFEAEDPELAATVANGHAEAYIQSILEARGAATDTASSWMSDRLAELQGQLSESDQRLQEFREQEQLIDAEGLKSLPAREVNELTIRLLEVRRELSQARIAFRQVYRGSNEPLNDLSSIPAILADPGVQDLQQVEAVAQGKVAELAKRYGPQHPRMIAVQSELANATDNLRNQRRTVAESIRNKYEAAVAEEADLASALNRAKQDYQVVGRKESALLALQREGDTNRELYDLFYNRISETAAAGDLISLPARIISPAVIPIYPSNPKKGLTVSLVFAASLGVAVLTAFLLEAVNNTIRSPVDVETKLNAPLLGTIPLLKSKHFRHTPLGNMFLSGSEPGFNEAVRTVRTSISLDNMQHPHKVIVIASAIGSEGKSTLALNLAHAFGQLENERVLLIDADMRRPSIASELNIATHMPGMSELLAGKTTLAKSLFRSVKYNMDVLSTGLVPKDPLELLASHHLTNALMVLRQNYDRIIIDTPPMLAVSDALVVAKQADSVIFVVKPETASTRQINHSLDQLIRVNARVSGIVLNQLDLQKAGLYGTYAYENY